ncbi:MAG: flagellar basal-body rod protein FlgG [Lachnospiraceae bacterium]|nr:flagellar basal-body rod protein FlgG [Lachnospiraceae bacterium]
MMRALWTGASGMIAQQTNVDTIGNNLANVNTTGYKAETAEFKSLLYQTVQDTSTDSEGKFKPLGVQVGLGVKNSAISTNFNQGSMLATGMDFDFAIEGEGFFMVRLDDGSTAYTRNGNFTMSIGTDGHTLTNGDGNPVLDANQNPVIIPEGYKVADVSIDAYGNLVAKGEDGNMHTIGVQVGMATFNNPGGLSKIGNSNYVQTGASGEPIISTPDAIGSKMKSGYLEGSNVQVVDEMVNLIVAQRAYEFNSKVINASDQMLQQANNLRS